MAKYSLNAPCPCGSKNKYKKCCAIYHQGALAPDALRLMKSRYSAYATGQSAYIIKTTHATNPDFTIDMKTWKQEIENFCNHTEFKGLKIIEFSEEGNIAYVAFEASLSSGLLKEKSRFFKEEGRWLYADGVFD